MVKSVPTRTGAAFPPEAEQMMEELVELLVARTFANKQETLGVETRVMKTVEKQGRGMKSQRNASWVLAAPDSSLLGFRHFPPCLSEGTLQRHLK